MGLERAKQIKKILAGFVQVPALAVSGTQINAASQLNTAVNNINDYSPVEVEQNKVSAGLTDVGMIQNSRVVVRTSANKRPISVGVVTDAGDGLNGQMIGGEVFGEVGVAFGVVTFYIETPDGQKHIVTVSNTVDLTFVYRFDFKDLPVDNNLILWAQTYQDPNSMQGRLVAEVRNVTSLNTLQNLSFQANTASPFFLYVNGKAEILRAGGKYTLGGAAPNQNKVVTWTAFNPVTNPNSYDLETSDEVVALYYTFE